MFAVDLSSCTHLTQLNIHPGWWGAFELPIWPDFTAYLLSTLLKPRNQALDVRITFFAGALLILYDSPLTRGAILAHTDALADALAQAADAGSVGRFVLRMFENEWEAVDSRVEEMRCAFRDKVVGLAGSCKVEVC